MDLGSETVDHFENPSDKLKPHPTHGLLSALSSPCSDQLGNQAVEVWAGPWELPTGLHAFPPSSPAGEQQGRVAESPELWSLLSSVVQAWESSSTSLIFHFPL